MRRIVGEDRRRQVRLAKARERRRLARLAFRARLVDHPVATSSAQGSAADIDTIAEFAASASGLQFRVAGDTAVIVSPDTFSFIDDPQGAVDTALRFARAIHENHRRVAFDQHFSSHIDLCALTVMEVLARQALKDRTATFQGRLPVVPELQEIIWATGLPSTLGLTGPSTEHFKVFELIHSRTGSIRGRTTSNVETYAERIAVYFKDCFHEYAYELSDDAQRLIAEGMGEILANADEHSGGRRWYAKAYLRKPRHQEYGDCHLVVFNFGESMAASLRRLPIDALLRDDIENYVRRHRGPRVHPRFQDDDLWTLLALQDGVSMKNVESRPPLYHRGLGTVHMIEMFQDLGRTASAEANPRMCVVSGNTHLTFDGTYRMLPSTTERGEVRKILAFNAPNDLNYPPDKAVFTRLKRPFPGTLVSMRFFLDPKYLRGLGGEYGTVR